MRILFLVLLLLIFDSQRSMAAAMPNLKLYFNSHIKYLSRDLIGFHYSKDKIPKNVSADKNQIFEIINNQLQSAMNASEPSQDNAGPGFYIAADPATSRQFGGGINFSLFVVTLKKGITILDARELTFENVDPKLLKEIQNSGCKIPSYFKNASPGFIWHWDFGFLVGNEDLNCRQSVQHILDSLNIDAVFFNYSASSSIPSCKREKPYAMNIRKINAVQRSELLLFDASGLNSSDQVIRKYIGHLFLQSVKEPGISFEIYDYNKIPRILWPQFDDRKTPIGYQTWLTEHIAGCGNYEEDKIK
jgi:hypothetical protein